MLPLPNLIILAFFTALGLAIFYAGSRYRGQGITFWGRSPIDNRIFLSGKISLFISWSLMLVKALLPGWNWNPVPSVVAWVATGLNGLGSLVMILAFLRLGAALRVGLPENDTRLETTGIYGISRNPIYLGVFLICIASCLFFPNPVNILLAGFGIYAHHRIILGEERFLAGRFGKEWEEYKARVRRYV